MASALQFLETEIRTLEELGLLRQHKPVPPQTLVLCSNDYLGYALEPWPTHPHDELAHAGAGASRLVSGEHPEHTRAEQILASWLDTESASAPVFLLRAEDLA